jgi:hypothetical protein
MLVAQELIDTVLNIDGTDLVADTYTIKAILGFSTVNLVDTNNIIIGSESQIFNFYTSTKYCLDNSVKEGDLFTTSDNLYEYNFKVANNPIPQLDGLSRIPASYLNKVEL